MSSQGGKLEIAGTVVGQWAGARRSRGRGGFPVQVVSVGGANRGYVDNMSCLKYFQLFFHCDLFVNHMDLFLPSFSRPRGVISTPVIRTFGRGGRYHARAFKNQGVYLVSQ